MEQRPRNSYNEATVKVLTPADFVNIYIANILLVSFANLLSSAIIQREATSLYIYLETGNYFD